MTVKGFVVTLEKDVSDEHAARIVEAFWLLRGVVSIKPVAAGYEDAMVADRVRRELRGKVLGAFNDA